MKPKIIALLTDFGTSDPFVGIMKAVIAEINPGATMIDITHQIPPGDIQRGAFVLWQASGDFPEGTVFLCVIDPGVGTSRKGIILETRNQIFIGPDNGLFSYLDYSDQTAAWELTNPGFQRQSMSATFHGRDLFAPAAAHAARGVRGIHFGDRVQKLERLPVPEFRIQGSSCLGEVLSVDHFGNLITSIGLFTQDRHQYLLDSWLGPDTLIIPKTGKIRIHTHQQSLPLVTTFGDIADGEAAGVVGSTGLLEIAANQQPAQKLLALEVGDPLELSWK